MFDAEVMQIREREHAESASLRFVIVDSFPESDPDVEHAKAAAQAANEVIGNEGSQGWPAQEQAIVGPLRPPGHDNEQDAHYGADENQQQYPDAVKPELRPRVRLSALSGWPGKTGGLLRVFGFP